MKVAVFAQAWGIDYHQTPETLPELLAALAQEDFPKEVLFEGIGAIRQQLEAGLASRLPDGISPKLQALMAAQQEGFRRVHHRLERVVGEIEKGWTPDLTALQQAVDGLKPAVEALNQAIGGEQPRCPCCGEASADECRDCGLPVLRFDQDSHSKTGYAEVVASEKVWQLEQLYFQVLNGKSSLWELLGEIDQLLSRLPDDSPEGDPTSARVIWALERMLECEESRRVSHLMEGWAALLESFRDLAA